MGHSHQEVKVMVKHSIASILDLVFNNINWLEVKVMVKHSIASILDLVFNNINWLENPNAKTYKIQ
jgi:hypothetical protein